MPKRRVRTPASTGVSPAAEHISTGTIDPCGTIVPVLLVLGVFDRSAALLGMIVPKTAPYSQDAGRSIRYLRAGLELFSGG